MKLVQLLAKELKEWPEIDECSDPILFITQDSSGAIFSWNDNGELKFVDGQWYMQGTIPFDEVIFDGSETCSDCSSAIAREDQWQAEREKMNKPKWIRHRGGKCPVADDVKVLYRMRSGTITSRGEPSSILIWGHGKIGADIMAYRVIEETKDQEIEEVKDKNIGTLSITVDTDDVFKPMIASMKEMALEWGQIESPLKWRDEIIELEAYEEEFRREREKLIRKLESEGFKLIDHMTPVYGEQIIDMSDWRNWQAGDIVECVTDDYAGVYTNGKHYVVELVKEDVFSVFDDCGKGSSCDWFDHESEGLKFIRRP